MLALPGALDGRRTRAPVRVDRQGAVGPAAGRTARSAGGELGRGHRAILAAAAARPRTGDHRPDIAPTSRRHPANEVTKRAPRHLGGVDSPTTSVGRWDDRRTNLIDQAVGRLRQQITSGRGRSGPRIPAEPELAELIGVGRNTVREAVQSLVHAGMLERRQGSGTYVISDSELGNAMGRQIAGAHQHDVLEVRRSLEVESRGSPRSAGPRPRWPAAPSCATRAPRPTPQRRPRAHGRQPTSPCTAGSPRPPHNPVLVALYENLQDAISANIRFNFEHPVHDDDSHHALVEAIAAGTRWPRCARSTTTCPSSSATTRSAEPPQRHRGHAAVQRRGDRLVVFCSAPPA